jgi:hypothetical protein
MDLVGFGGEKGTVEATQHCSCMMVAEWIMLGG